ncbi:MAG: response regulator [Chloroflexi bacterium]|mgnify:FL=1|nr:response regulator [Chloroflexota bacterium]
MQDTVVQSDVRPRTKQAAEQKKTILVVEDSPVQAAQIRALLVAHGLHVELAEDGIYGLEKAEIVDPALIILDLEMPRMNGVETARALKKNPATRNIPLILFTRHGLDHAKALGLEDGMIDFIPKDAFAKVVMIETLKQMGIIS